MQWSRRRKILFLMVLLAINGAALFAAGNLPLGGAKAIEAPMLDQSRHDTALVYFGFPECSTACPLTLQRLAGAYSKLQSEADGLDVFFVNLEPSAKPGHTRTYARGFHPDFHAIAPADQQRARLSRSFGAWLYRTGSDSEPFHNPYVYLVTRSDKNWEIQNRIPADEDVVPAVRSALSTVTATR